MSNTTNNNNSNYTREIFDKYQLFVEEQFEKYEKLLKRHPNLITDIKDIRKSDNEIVKKYDFYLIMQKLCGTVDTLDKIQEEAKKIMEYTKKLESAETIGNTNAYDFYKKTYSTINDIAPELQDRIIKYLNKLSLQPIDSLYDSTTRDKLYAYAKNINTIIVDLSNPLTMIGAAETKKSFAKADFDPIKTPFTRENLANFISNKEILEKISNKITDVINAKLGIINPTGAVNNTLADALSQIKKLNNTNLNNIALLDDAIQANTIIGAMLEDPKQFYINYDPKFSDPESTEAKIISNYYNKYKNLKTIIETLTKNIEKNNQYFVSSLKDIDNITSEKLQKSNDKIQKNNTLITAYKDTISELKKECDSINSLKKYIEKNSSFIKKAKKHLRNNSSNTNKVINRLNYCKKRTEIILQAERGIIDNIYANNEILPDIKVLIENFEKEQEKINPEQPILLEMADWYKKGPKEFAKSQLTAMIEKANTLKSKIESPNEDDSNAKIDTELLHLLNTYIKQMERREAILNNVYTNKNNQNNPRIITPEQNTNRYSSLSQ